MTHTDSEVRPWVMWIALITATLARSALWMGVGLVLWGALPALWGWMPTSVMSDSMAPAVRTGDVVIAMPAESADLTIGRIVLADDPDHAGRLRLHRLVDTTESGDLVLRGDANATSDSTPVSASAVRGVAVLRVPFAGWPAVWTATGNGAAFALLVVVAAGLAVVGMGDVLISRAHTRRDLNRPPRARAGDERSVIALTAVALVISGAVSGVSWTPSTAHAAFASTTPNASSSLTATGAYPCLEPTVADAPFLLYRFNESAGTTATDSSGNARTGTTQGTTTRVSGSCVANASPALTLDGTTGYVSTAASVAGTNVFSVELWFRTTTAAGGRLIGFGNAQTGVSGSYDRHIYMTNAGKLIFGVYPGSVKIITSPLSYNDGAWHHVVATLSAAGMKLSVDGSVVASDAATTTAQSYTGFWKVGFDSLSGWTSIPTSRYFAGTIDSAAVYTTALSGAQISAHFAAGH